jgi:nucleolar protein 56
MYSRRRELEEYIGNLMESVAPNMTVLAGPMVSARLISLAGSLKELARKPSSTIQIYGAEKALFRSMKTKATPPKHGVIFQVPLIHSAPYWQRGKLSRALAGKLTIAARVDAYSDRDIGDNLLEELNSRVEEIKKQHPEPDEQEEKKKDDTHRRSRESKGRGRNR